MKLALTVLLIIHGLIHLMGFISSYFSASIHKQILGIPKPLGALWLIVFILFMVAASALITNKIWFYVACIAVVMSQILIVLAWKDAKFGTIVNIIILIASYTAYSHYKFNKMVKNETAIMLQHITSKNSTIISEKDILHLPEIVQQWMRNSGAIGKEKITSVYLKQKGKMKIKPNGKWLNFKAEQYFNVEHPAFVWSTNVDVMPLLKIVGRDKLIHGQGAMLIKLAGIIPVVNESKNNKINTAAMLRYLAEIVWFPSAALNDYVEWETIDTYKAKATLTLNEISVSGVFKFSSLGDMQHFKAERYYKAEKNTTLETWFIKALAYKNFNGYKVPSKCSILWKLKSGDFNWLNLEITRINYNSL